MLQHHTPEAAAAVTRAILMIIRGTQCVDRHTAALTPEAAAAAVVMTE
jgi:hypothetical protein